MKAKVLKQKIILLTVFCQLLCYFVFSSPAKAISNELIITCPSESQLGTDISCTLSGRSASEINQITATFSLSNLKIKNFTMSSGWTNNNTSNTSIDISSTKATKNFTIGTLTLTPQSIEQPGSIYLENIEFKNTDFYSFSAASEGAQIAITSPPITPICADNEELINNTCVKKQIICDTTEDLIDGECVEKTPVCSDDEELIDNKCVKKEVVCNDDEELIDGECVEKTITCKENEELKDGKCVTKITTTTCKSDEILQNNSCAKKQSDPDYLLIILISGGVIIFVAIIVLIIILLKKKGTSNSNSYLGGNGQSLKKHSKNTAQGFTKEDFERFGINGEKVPQTGKYTQPKPPTSTTTPTYDNGTFMARTGSTSEIGTEPKENTDPRFSMNLQSPSQNMTSDTIPTATTTPITSIITNAPIATEIHNDPHLQYNFSTQQTTTPQTQTQIQQFQSPITSAYNIATQVTSQPIQAETTPIIQTTPVNEQPIAPIYTPQTQQPTPLNQSNQTSTVPLTAPTNPIVFES